MQGWFVGFRRRNYKRKSAKILELFSILFKFLSLSSSNFFLRNVAPKCQTIQLISKNHVILVKKVRKKSPEVNCSLGE
jgi:hypothetical protein